MGSGGLRIAVGGIEHETNTYATESMGTTGLDDFQRLEGELIHRAKGTRTFLGGFLDAAEAAGHEVVPTFWALAGPSGIIEADAYETMRTELVERLTSAHADESLDGIALSMHGAGVVEGIDDLESDLARAVRASVGDVPLVVPLDLHGNITPAMGDAIDVMLGVHEYPHTDSYDRGVEAIELLPALAERRLRPVTHVTQIPILLPTSTTDEGPAAAMRDRCLAAELDPAVIDATFFHGFPYTDVAATGTSIVVTTNGDRALARRVADELALSLWDERSSFLTESLRPDVAMDVAIRSLTDVGGPVVVNDTSDNPGGGTPGDGTHLLRAMVDAAVDGSCFGFVFDPVVAAQANEAGVGATIDVRLGGRHGDLHGEPVEATAYVKTLTDGRFVYENEMLAGVRANYGPCARLVLNADRRGAGGIDVIVTSRRSQTFDPVVFALHGIDVSTRSIVGLKSSQHYRAGFRDLATAFVTADSPGLTTLDVTVFDHPSAAGPLWPIDPHLEWAPSPDD